MSTFHKTTKPAAKASESKFQRQKKSDNPQQLQAPQTEQGITPNFSQIKVYDTKEASKKIDQSDPSNKQLLMPSDLGETLEPETKNKMAQRLNGDFGEVRVHTSSEAANVTKALNSKAFCLGSHIYFGKDQFSPKTNVGQQLLTHELIHFQQQKVSGRELIQNQLVESSQEASPPEQEATKVSQKQPGILSQAVTAEIKKDVDGIIKQLKASSPNKTQILFDLKRWDEKDRALSEPESLTHPHVNKLLDELNNRTFEESSMSTLGVGQMVKALDKLLNLMRKSTGTTELFNQIIQSSKYANYLAGPETRSVIDWKGRLADELRTSFRNDNFAKIQQELDNLFTTNRDDVSLELIKYLDNRELLKAQQSKDGQALLSRLFDELTSGSFGGDEKAQADRILAVKATKKEGKEDKQDEFLSAEKMVFPFRKTGMTVGALGLSRGAAHIYATRRKEGKIWVQMKGTVLRDYPQEAITLPREVFNQGIEIPESKIVGVRLYDEGETLVLFPALYLIQISNEGVSRVYEKIGETAGLALSMGGGSVVGGGVEATLATRILAIADKMAGAFGVITSVILENRGYFLKQPWGKEFVESIEVVNSAVSLYGFARVATEMPKLFENLGSTYKKWRELNTKLEEKFFSKSLNRKLADSVEEIEKTRAPLPSSVKSEGKQAATLAKTPEKEPLPASPGSVKKEPEPKELSMAGPIKDKGQKEIPPGSQARVPQVQPGALNVSSHESWVEWTSRKGLAKDRPAIPIGPYMRQKPRTYSRGIASPSEAMKSYDDAIYLVQGKQEIAILRSKKDGSYAIQIGGEISVGIPEDFESVLHFHPGYNNILTFRNPSPRDVENMILQAFREGKAKTEFIEHTVPGGNRRLTKYTYNTDGTVIVEYAAPTGERVSKEFSSVKKYQEEYFDRTFYVDPKEANAVLGVDLTPDELSMVAPASKKKQPSAAQPQPTGPPITDPNRLLTAGWEADKTRAQIANLKSTGYDRGMAANKHAAQLQRGKQEVPEMTKKGKRIHDVKAFQSTVTDLRLEVKNYRRYRRVEGRNVAVEVPLSAEIKDQVEKDVLWIREGKKVGIHRVVQWDFYGAQPSQELREALEKWGQAGYGLSYVETIK